MYERKSNLGSDNINTLTGEYSGFYSQGLNANATTANGYPVASAGALLVIKNGANGKSGCTQLYFPYNGTNGVFYMRQYIIQSSATGWEWSAWKKFQSLDFADSPQFKNLNLVISSDNEVTNGGILQSILTNTSGEQRARTRIYTEFRGDNHAWATIHLQRGDQNKYAGLSEDGDFVLSTGDFVAKSARLLSNVNAPFTLTSAHPTIKFDETDRPEGAPDYAFICDGGNWRIERDHWDTSKAKNCIAYSYSTQEITVPNLSTQNVAIHGGVSSGPGTLRIESQKSSDEGMYIQAWGNGTDRLSVMEVKLDSGFLFYVQKVADGSRVLRVNGSVTCTTVNQLSDRDLKDNIQVIGDATEAIRKMNGYTYTLKENGLPYAGIIAQEVMEALPEAVGSFTHYGEELQGPTVDGRELREETRYLNVDYAAVTGLLVQVARETDNRVTELEEENASLRANIAVMDERIAKLEALVSKLTGSEK
ncbi:tail fiber domain-containing protein [Escherichia coli]